MEWANSAYHLVLNPGKWHITQIITGLCIFNRQPLEACTRHPRGDIFKPGQDINEESPSGSNNGELCKGLQIEKGEHEIRKNWS
jgi:hypothetical protein